MEIGKHHKTGLVHCVADCLGLNCYFGFFFFFFLAVPCMQLADLSLGLGIKLWIPKSEITEL